MSVLIKRPFDMMATDSPDKYDMPPVSLAKRCRLFTPRSPKSPKTVAGFHCTRAKPTNPSSAFQPSPADQSAEADKHIWTHINQKRSRRKQRKTQAEGIENFMAPSNFPESMSTHAHSNPTPNTCHSNHGQADERPKQDVVFTVDQVRAIVANALRDKETELSAQYDAILQERLREQFAMFSKYNEDHIHQRMSNSDFSYMS